MSGAAGDDEFTALIALARLAANSERVALLIGALRIAGSDGVEFLVRAQAAALHWVSVGI